MSLAPTRLRGPALGAWWLLSLLVSYGSLFPFRFAIPPAGAIAAFSQTLGVPHSAGDVLGNIALFCPLGIVSAFLVRRWPVELLGWAALATGLAFALQVAQIALPHRDATIDDAVLNVMGFALGVALGWLLRRVVAGEFPGTGSVGLLGLWAIGLLVPLLPDLEAEALRHSLAPLQRAATEVLRAPDARLALLQSGAGAYAVCTLWSMLLGSGAPCAPSGRTARTARTHALLLAASLIALVLAGRVAVAGLRLDWPLLLGAGGGLAAWQLRPRVLATRAIVQADEAIAALALGGTYALLALSPYTFSGNPRPFNWWPLVDLLYGGMLDNVQTLLPRLFLLGGCCWFALQRARRPWRVLSLLVLGCMALEVLQCLIPGRTPSVTDAVLVLGCGVTCMGLLIARQPEADSPRGAPAP